MIENRTPFSELSMDNLGEIHALSRVVLSRKEIPANLKNALRITVSEIDKIEY